MWFGTSVVVVSGAPVIGDRDDCAIQRSTAVRSYVKPSAAMTGSDMRHDVIGQMKSGGVDESSRSERLSSSGRPPRDDPDDSRAGAGRACPASSRAVAGAHGATAGSNTYAGVGADVVSGGADGAGGGGAGAGAGGAVAGDGKGPVCAGGSLPAP